jgi:hypothetical protein
MPKWLAVLVQLVLANISQPLREAIVKAVKEWEATAATTASPIDDMVVAIVKAMLIIP